MSDSTVDIANLPWFLDVLIETKTRRDDWLYSAREIAGVLEMDKSTLLGLLDAGKLPGRRVRPEGRGAHLQPLAWIMKKADAVAYFKAHQPKPEPPQPEPVKPSPNGHKEHDVVILKQGSPILSERDGEAIMRGLWDNKLATQNLTKAIDALTQAIKEFKEVMK